MTSVSYDSATGGPNHHMLPFELLSVIIATTVPALLLALLTRGSLAGSCGLNSLEPVDSGERNE